VRLAAETVRKYQNIGVVSNPRDAPSGLCAKMGVPNEITMAKRTAWIFPKVFMPRMCL
jgi:hypothetical protein